MYGEKRDLRVKGERRARIVSHVRAVATTVMLLCGSFAAGEAARIAVSNGHPAPCGTCKAAT